MQRSCGGCTACCTTLDVPDVNAPAGCDCVHQGPDGCGIYLSRPQICRDWQCQWMADNDFGPPLMLDNERPDRIGLLVNVERMPDGPVLIVHEIVPGAIAANWPMLERLSCQARVLLRKYRGAPP